MKTLSKALIVSGVSILCATFIAIGMIIAVRFHFDEGFGEPPSFTNFAIGASYFLILFGVLFSLLDYERDGEEEEDDR